MTTYFDSTNTAHLLLIVHSVRAHKDIATVAEQSEYDVIEHFTRHYPAAVDYVNNFYVGQGYHKGNGVYVALEGFNPDADAVDAAYADLVTALRYTIADVINWRLSKYGESPLLESISTAQGVGKTFREEMKQDFPPDWARRLKRHEIKLPIYHI